GRGRRVVVAGIDVAADILDVGRDHQPGGLALRAVGRVRCFGVVARRWQRGVGRRRVGVLAVPAACGERDDKDRRPHLRSTVTAGPAMPWVTPRRLVSPRSAAAGMSNCVEPVTAMPIANVLPVWVRANAT